MQWSGGCTHVNWHNLGFHMICAMDIQLLISFYLLVVPSFRDKEGKSNWKASHTISNSHCAEVEKKTGTTASGLVWCGARKCEGPLLTKLRKVMICDQWAYFLFIACWNKAGEPKE